MAVAWSAAARADLDRIFDLNLTRSDAWALKVDLALRDQAEALAQRPMIGRRVGRTSLRSWAMPDLQYVLRYRVGDGGITVVQVRHSRELSKVP